MTVSKVTAPVGTGLQVAKPRRLSRKGIVIASIAGVLAAIAIVLTVWLTSGTTSVAPATPDHTAQLQRLHADAYGEAELARMKALQNFHEDANGR